MAFDAGAIKARLTIDKSQWDKSAKQIKTSQQKLAVQSKKTGMAFKGMWKQMAIGIGITGGVTMVIRGLMRQMADTIKVGRSFEKEWANVTSMMNLSRTATDKMKYELRMLSPTLGDTTELAKGMYQVLSASIEPAKAIKFLGEAAKSAKAGVTETKIAVDAMTTVINAYGMEAEAATEVSDIMFATVKRGKLTYEELATSLGTVIPVAATIGVEFRDVAAAVASLTRQGVVASKATMQLRQVMMSILKPSAEAEEITEDLGIAMGKNALETIGLAGWLDILREKTKGNADIMTKIVPNVRALTAVLALTGKAAEGFAYDQEFMTETMGFTDEAFRKQMESVDFWIETFETAADKIKIAFYEGLTASLRESITSAEDFDEKITKATNDAANSVSLHVSTMVDVFGKLKKVINAQTWPLLLLRDIITGNKKSTNELEKATNELRDAMLQAVPEGAIEDIEGFKEANEYLKIAIDETLEPIDMMTRATEIFRGKLEELYEFEGIWDALMPPSVAIERWNAFYDLVETPELDLIWEQQMGNMEEDTLNFMASIIPGMAFMTKKITDDFKKTGDNVKLSMSDMAMTAGTILTALAGKSKGLAIAGAIISTYAAAAKTLQTYGMPLAIPFIAMAIAAGLKQVSMIKAQAIPSAAEGGWIPKPALIEAGHGPGGEVIVPFDRAPIGGMGATVSFNFYAPIISTTGLSDKDVDEVTEYFFDRMDSEAKRRGYSINGS